MIDVIWPGETQSGIFETLFSYRSCRDISRQLIESVHEIGSWINLNGNNDRGDKLSLITKNDALIRKIKALISNFDTIQSEYILVVTSPEVVISSQAVDAMIDVIKRGYCICLPVYNETVNEKQIASVPYQYLNFSTYVEVSELVLLNPFEVVEISGFISESPKIVKDLDLSCVMLQTKWFKDAIANTLSCLSHNPYSINLQYSAHLALNPMAKSPLSELLFLIQALLTVGKSATCAVSRNALVHKFGDYYSGEREQLVEMVSDTAVNVLDLGSARGGFGKRLKRKRADIQLSGIEKDPFLAQEALLFYDYFYQCDVEDVDFVAQFDHINCGEFIEHVYDPWTLVDKLYQFLKPGGTICLSLPNAGHWTVVKELLGGQFQYITIGLQCVTHIRWFTESSIRQLLERAGFSIEDIIRLEIPPTPQGELFVRQMCELGYANRVDLMTFDIIIKAVKT